MNPRSRLLEKISNIQRELMGKELPDDYFNMLPIIRKAIETIEAKGVPVTIQSIQNHLPLGQMSTSSRMECNKYLKELRDKNEN